MDNAFSLELVTPFDGVRRLDCEALTVTLSDGEACFLRSHAPFLGVLPAGTIQIRRGETVDRYAIDEAFLQVSPAGAALFTDRCQKL